MFRAKIQRRSKHLLGGIALREVRDQFFSRLFDCNDIPEERRSSETAHDANTNEELDQLRHQQDDGEEPHINPTTSSDVASPCSHSTSCFTFPSNHHDIADFPTVLATRSMRHVRSLLFPKKAQVALHKLAHGKDGESLTAVVVNDVAVAVMDARLARDGPAQGAAWFPTVFCLVLLNALVEYVVAHAEEEDAPGAATTWADVLAAHGTVDDAVSVALMCRVMQALLLNPLPAAGEPRSMVWTSSATSSFVLRGAHLMKAGVLGSHCGTGDDQHGALSLSYIATRWCPVPYAVGVLQPWQPDDDKGVAVTVLHTLHDALWQHFAPSFLTAVEAFDKKRMNVNLVENLVVEVMFESGKTPQKIVREGPRPLPVPRLTDQPAEEGASLAIAEKTEAASLVKKGDKSPTADPSSQKEGTVAEDGGGDEPVGNEEDDDEEDEQMSEDGEEENEEGTTPAIAFDELFPNSDAILFFALRELVLQLPHSQMPMPTNTFVALLGKKYPRGLPENTAAHGLLSSILTANKSGFNFKKTTFKQSLAFLKKSQMVLTEEVRPGVHEVTGLVKSVARDTRSAALASYIDTVHEPQMEREKIDAELSSGSVSLPKVTAVEYQYIPHDDMPEDLYEVLCRYHKRVTSTNNGAKKSQPLSKGKQDDDEDDGDDDVMDEKQVGKNLRAYCVDNGLLVLTLPPDVLAVLPPSDKNGPWAQVDRVLALHWLRTPAIAAPTHVSLQVFGHVLLRTHFVDCKVIRFATTTRTWNYVKYDTGMQLPKIHIEAKKCKGNKSRTVVDNLEPFAGYVHHIATEWKRLFGVSTNVFSELRPKGRHERREWRMEERPMTVTPVRIELQGNQIVELSDWLVRVVHWPATLIETVKRKGVRSKKIANAPAAS